jgi:hypothetical protein
MPVSNTFENAEGGKFHFHVEIGLPWTGLIVRYRDWPNGVERFPLGSVFLSWRERP